MVEVHENCRKGPDSSEREARLARLRELVEVDLRRGRLRSKITYVHALIEEFSISKRTGYDDFDTVWAEIRKSEDKRIMAAQLRICARLDDYVAELADLYEECRIEGDRGQALATWKEIGRALQLLAPDRLDVTIATAPYDLSKLSLDEKRVVLESIRKAKALSAGD